MRYRALGPSGIETSVIGFGTWAIGGWMWGGADDDRSVRSLHAALDAGINLVDTAPIYGFGRSEEIVGRAIHDRRDRVVLATKCGLIWHAQRGEFNFRSDDQRIARGGPLQVYRCLAPDTIRYEVEQSLRRLRTDRIDLLQTHWQEPTTPVADTMAELLALKEEGKIRAIGCSNATPEQMEAYGACGPLDTDQERYSMLDRKMERANLPFVAERGIAFLAYSPLAQGLLTGKVGPERTFPEGDLRHGNPLFSRENRLKVRKLLDAIRPLADRRGVTLGQYALAWTVAQPGCTHALAGARTPVQAVENARAGDLVLGDGELRAVRTALDAYEAA